MPDGRSVPVCVIEATRADSADTAVDPTQLIFPKNMIAGGFPIYARVQGEDHIASVGCVVSDGHRAYAITNRHVAGEEGSPIYSRLGNQEVEIGLSSSKQLSKVPFTKFYPNWPGHDVFVNADVGLVDLHDLKQWKTEIYGIGPLQEPADLGAHNMTLKLIGA